MSVQHSNIVVGRVPIKILASSLLFLQRARRICYKVVGVKRPSADVPQGRLEVPCMNEFLGEPKDVAKN